MTALEYVHDLDEFMTHAKKRKHWNLHRGIRMIGYRSVTVNLTALDDKERIIKYSKYFGQSDYDAPYEERKKQFDEIEKKARKFIALLPTDFSEGLWVISK